MGNSINGNTETGTEKTEKKKGKKDDGKIRDQRKNVCKRGQHLEIDEHEHRPGNGVQEPLHGLDRKEDSRGSLYQKHKRQKQF